MNADSKQTGAPPGAAGPRCALIIDDNRTAATLSCAVLKAAGLEVDLARDGFEAIVCLRRRAYSTVLLDYRLPGMDGVEVMEWIRRNIASPPEVIVLSSDNAQQLVRKFAGLGVKAILSKPIHPVELCRAVAE